MRTLRLPVSGPVRAFAFDDLPAGTYALAVYHDEKNNGQLYINWGRLSHRAVRLFQ